MNSILLFQMIGLTAFMWLPSALGETNSDNLLLQANTPDVAISTRPASQNMIWLPKLDYTFQVNASCRAGFKIESVSLNIADTRASKIGNELTAVDTLEFGITVPAAQIGPIALGHFCIQEEEKSRLKINQVKKLPSVLSVQAALLCSNGELSKITYASKPLDVVVHCQP